MSQEADKFLHAEQSAQELLQSLEQLKNVANSYKTSTHELDAVKQKVSELIDSFSPVIKGTHDVVVALKSTGPEILDKLGSISAQLANEAKTTRIELQQSVGSLSEQFDRLKLLVIIGLSVASLSVIGIVVLLLR